MSNRYTYSAPVLTKLALFLSQRTEPQYRIAAACNMSPSRLSEYVNGKRHIATHHLEALAAYLKCDCREIMGVAESELVED